MKYFYILLILITQFLYAEPPEMVYRADMGRPDEIKRAGGFYPRGMDGSRPNQPPPNINLFDHTNGAATGMARHDSGYVSTSRSRGLAISWINDHLNHNAYIYHIRATPNMVDVNEILQGYSPHPMELEFAALGIIRWDQVIGWERVVSGTVHQFQRNRDYRERLYTNLRASDRQYQLAGFPPEHQAWGVEPWRDFANCGGRTKEDETCEPKKEAQEFGEISFSNVMKKMFAPTLLILMSNSFSDDDD